MDTIFLAYGPVLLRRSQREYLHVPADLPLPHHRFNAAR